MRTRKWSSRHLRERGEHQLYESVVQKAVAHAARKASLSKQANCRGFRYSLATHFLEEGHDTGIVEKLRGHKDVKTTMIYTHLLNRGGRGARTPLDAS